MYWSPLKIYCWKRCLKSQESPVKSTEGGVKMYWSPLKSTEGCVKMYWRPLTSTVERGV